MVPQVKYAFKAMTLGQAEKYQTRVGVISYGNNITEFARLTTFSSFDQFYQQNVPWSGAECSDLKGAIDLARDGFERDHKVNRKKLLIIASGGYRQGSYENPKSSADTFKTNQGTIMVLTFEAGVASNDLRQLASPSYFLDASNGIQPDKIYNMFCQANCFCPCISNCSSEADRWIASGGDPNNGCYLYPTTGGIQYLAEVMCSKNSGTLAMPKNSGDCLSVLNADKTNGIWIGLQNKGNVLQPDWRWLDGTAATPDITSQLNAANGNCTVLASTNGFAYAYSATDCNNYKCWSCYIAPCSSTNYCG
ncbi:unnamed protein product, partial [Mesorhabditis belari]|uniref:Uncharacterized protein n=1 Tax=Mesorhabditis belari TaxID=2138241 RepID=A0AAF3J7A8_9BILA